jgi:hypothetical protein
LLFVWPLAALFAGQWLGLLTLAVMSLTYWPTTANYNLHWSWALALPLVVPCYLWFTLISAANHYLKQSGQWKGRSYAQAS